jgi:hypothetical protein
VEPTAIDRQSLFQAVEHTCPLIRHATAYLGITVLLSADLEHGQTLHDVGDHTPDKRVLMPAKSTAENTLNRRWEIVGLRSPPERSKQKAESTQDGLNLESQH